MTLREQKKQRESVNVRISAAESIEEKFTIAEAWCKENGVSPKIELSNMGEPDVLSIGLYSDDIVICTQRLTQSHIPFLIQLINNRRYFWRNYERLQIWQLCNQMLRPKNPFLIQPIEGFKTFPSTDLIGKVCAWSKIGVSFDYFLFKNNPMFICDESPEGFAEFCQAAKKSLYDGVVVRSELYTTVRYGMLSSGGHNRCEFDVVVNDQSYHVVIGSAEGGGSADSPPRWRTSITITPIPPATNNPIAEITTKYHAAVVFKNLANWFPAAEIVWW